MIRRWKKKVLVILLILVWIGGQASGIFTEKVYAAPTSSTLGGINGKGNLKITIIDGNVSVARHDGSSFVNQYYTSSSSAASTALLSIGDGAGKYVLGAGSYWSNGSGSPIASQMISSDNRSINTIWQLGTMEVAQKITLSSNSAQFIKYEWKITNNGSVAENDLHFLRGADTFLAGGDSGSGFWDEETNTVGVTKTINGALQRLGMQGVTIPNSYSSEYYEDIITQLNRGTELNNQVDPQPDTDNAYALEWYKEVLNPGDSWSIIMYESFVNSSVTASGDNQSVTVGGGPGEPVTLTYNVRNSSLVEQNIQYSFDYPAGWTVTPERTNDNIAPNSSVTLTVQIIPSLDSPAGLYEVILTLLNDMMETQAVGTVSIEPVIFEAGDPTELETAIDTAASLLAAHLEGTNVGQASETARTALQDAIDIAQAAADGAANQTQEELDEAAAALEAAIAVFADEVIKSGDADELTAALSLANGLLAAHLEGTNVGQASEAARTALQDAIDSAQAAADGAANQTQGELDAATFALEAAINAFEEAIVKQGDASGLKGALTSANGLLLVHTEGMNVGQASEATRTALQDAINVAQAVADDAENQTQEQLDTAMATLEAAMMSFADEVFQAGDAADLEAAIASANGLLAVHSEGTNVGEVSEAARTALQNAIEAAQAIADLAEDKTAEQLEAALEEMNTALAIFVNEVVKPGDSTPLYTVLAEANELLTNHQEGSDVGQASQLARTTLQNAIAAAQTVADNGAHHTQEQLDAAMTVLESALAAFADEVIKPGDSAILHTVLTEANELLLAHLEGSKVGQASKTARTELQDAVAAAQTIVDHAANYTQAQLDNAITALEEAIDIFKGKVVKKSSGSNDYIPVPVKQEVPGDEATVLVNGKPESTGTVTTTKTKDRTAMTIVVDEKKLAERLSQTDENVVVTIPVSGNPDVVIGELNGQMVKVMDNKQATIEIKTDRAIYTIPAQQMNINAIAKQMGESVALQDIKIQIEIAAPPSNIVKVVEDTAKAGSFILVAPPVEFTVRAVHGDKTIEITTFNAYVQRSIVIPDDVDPNKITTGVVIEQDGTVRHVPTKIVMVEGKYYAQINSLTNSLYSVVWNPQEFSDVAHHWAKEAVNDMGSRMVIEGIGQNLFDPNKDITRAEFATIIVRGLGLKLENGETPFSDVKATDWFSGAVNTAVSYGLINGFEDSTFRPNDKITREQAMVIVARAMVLTNLKATLPVQAGDAVLGTYIDAIKTSTWAKNGVADSIQAGIVSGRSSTLLAPQANITRAEVAVIIQRLLQNSDLI